MKLQNLEPVGYKRSLKHLQTDLILYPFICPACRTDLISARVQIDERLFYERNPNIKNMVRDYFCYTLVWRCPTCADELGHDVHHGYKAEYLLGFWKGAYEHGITQR